MTKPKSSASSVVVPSILAIHFANGALFLNATCAAGAATTKCKHRYNHKD